MESTTIDLSDAVWRTSTYSNGEDGDCVAVADGVAGLVPVRDSKVQGGPVLMVGATAWHGFVQGLKSH
ncbi:DUF397 domain-containing protein [Streptomyces sp. NPDC051563]|uniref:DUF397 domain-containing protein n=1 Tax=Streptomyces sp. NPDC051563 TaxID=3365659 RepID=UPI00379B9D5A